MCTAYAADLAYLRIGQAWPLQAEALLSQEGDQCLQEQIFVAWRETVTRHNCYLPSPFAYSLALFVGMLTPDVPTPVYLDERGRPAAHQQ